MNINLRCVHKNFYNPQVILDPHEFLQSVEKDVNSFLEAVMLQHGGNNIKFNFHLKMEFVKDVGDDDEEDARKIVFIATKYALINYYKSIPNKVYEGFVDLLQRIEDINLEGSGFVLDEIEFLDCHIVLLVDDVLNF